MKKLLTIMIALALIAGAGVMKAEAATSDSIAITVTFQSVSVSVSPDAWPMGAVTTAKVLIQACTATNNGNVNEDLNIAVTDSADWTAETAAGADQFVMDFSLTGSVPWTNITTGGVSLTSGLSPGGQTFTLQFTAPVSSSSAAQQSISVTVSASAS